jgi:ribonuclease Z
VSALSDRDYLISYPSHIVPSLGYILQEPVPRVPLDTAALIPLLQANATALASLPEPVHHPLSLLSLLTSLPPPSPYVLPSGESLHPPGPSGIHPRKIVIFGDCSGGTKNRTFQTMCEDPSLLIHECTNGALPEGIQRGEKGRRVRVAGLAKSLVEKNETQTGEALGRETRDGIYEVDDVELGDGAERSEAKIKRQNEEIEKVRKKANGRGHSIPQDVGLFAKEIRARRLVINHFSAM